MENLNQTISPEQIKTLEALKDALEKALTESETILAVSDEMTESTERVMRKLQEYLANNPLPVDTYSRIQRDSETNATLAQQLLYNVECLDLTEEDQADLLDRVVRRETQAIATDLTEAGALAQLEFVLSQSEYDVAIALEKIMTGYWGRKRTRRYRVGEFEVSQGTLSLAEPFSPDIPETQRVPMVQRGTWAAGLYQTNEKGVGVVNAGIILYHEDSKFMALNECAWVVDDRLTVPVESGTIGIFDCVSPEIIGLEWYEKMRDQVADSPDAITVLPLGVAVGNVSEGRYKVSIAIDEDHFVIGLAIIFVRFAEDLTIAKVVKHFRVLENRDYPGRLLYALKSKQLTQAQIDGLLNRSVRSLALSQVDSVLEADSLEKAEYLVGGLDFATALSELVSQAEQTLDEENTVEQLTIA